MRPATLHSAFAVLAVAAIALACGPTYPNCDHDDQCHEGEFCVGGHCEDCRNDTDCPTGQSCQSNDCAPIPGWCGTDSSCPTSQRCEANRCVPRPVASAVETTTTTPTTPQQCQLGPVYFAFDESTLDAAARSALVEDRACLTERGVTSVMITGMTDPRGTEEYNLALGSRRAEVIRGHLRHLGVERRSMATRSVGEESATGTEESGFSRDRRAEIAPR